MHPTESYPKFMVALELIRQGRMPTRACREAGISWSQLKRALTADAELSALFEEALLECRDQMVEALVSMNDPATGQLYSESDSKMANVISANIKWVLEKMWPEKFMTKLTVTHNSTADQAIISALNAAIERIPVPTLPAPAPQIEALPYTDFEILPARDLEAELASVL